MGFLDRLLQGATGGVVDTTGVTLPEEPAAPAPPKPTYDPFATFNPPVLPSSVATDASKFNDINPFTLPFQSDKDVDAYTNAQNAYKFSVSKRKTELENLLSQAGYQYVSGKWGKSEGSSGDLTVTLDEYGNQVVKGGGTKFTPLDPSQSALLAEWNELSRVEKAINENDPNWSQIAAAYKANLPTGSSGSGGGGSGGGSGSGVKVKTLLELEQDKADEVSRQRKEGEGYTDEYMDVVGKYNDALLQEASRAKASNAMWSDSYDKATEADVLRNQGKLNWDQGAVAPTFSDPLHYLKMEQIDPRIIEMWKKAVPETILPTYNLNEVVGLPGKEGFTDADYEWLPRFPNGTTTPIWDQIRNGTLKVNQDGSYSSTQGSGSNTVTPASNLPPAVQPYADYNPSTTYGPGRVPINSVLPASERIADLSTWVNNVVDGMIGNILSGKGGYPPGYNGPKWDDYIDDNGRTVVDPNFKVGLTQWVKENANNPGLTQIWGTPPSTQAIYIDDPSKPPASSTTVKATQVPSGGGGTSGGTIYTGVYGGQGSAAANDRSDPDLDKKLGWEREKFEWEKQRDLIAEQLANKQDLRSDQILELQKKQQEAEQRIADADLILRQISSELEKNKFEYTKEWNDKQMALDKEKFEYQKTRDDKADQLQRANLTSEMLANPNDQYRLQFFMQGQASPVGTAYDAFTGESRGQKTYDQARAEDAELFRESLRAPRMPTGGYTRSILSILGDEELNKATGHEEMVYNPTEAPLMVINNKDSTKTGLVPPKGKPFGKHVKLGA